MHGARPAALAVVVAVTSRRPWRGSAGACLLLFGAGALAGVLPEDRADVMYHYYNGDKSHGWPFLHLDDLVSAVRQTIAKRYELEPFEVLSLAEDELMSYGEQQDRIG